MDYFSLLNLPQAFDLDETALQAAYFQQQRLFHPDRFAGKPALERQQALQHSVDINQAYQVLKNPLARAQHILWLQGIKIGTDEDSIKPSQALLIEVMEWREEGIAQDALMGLYCASIATISNAYKNAQWEPMAQETLRLGYIIKTQEDMARQKKI